MYKIENAEIDRIKEGLIGNKSHRAFQVFF